MFCKHKCFSLLLRERYVFAAAATAAVVSSSFRVLVFIFVESLSESSSLVPNAFWDAPIPFSCVFFFSCFVLSFFSPVNSTHTRTTIFKRKCPTFESSCCLEWISIWRSVARSLSSFVFSEVVVLGSIFVCRRAGEGTKERVQQNAGRQ